MSTGASRAIDSDDDDIGNTVMSHIGENCQDLIAQHLNQGRVVFVAKAAIQAFDYDATIEDVAAGQASVRCGRLFNYLCQVVAPEAEGSAKYRNKSHTSLARTYVTFAVLPAEIGDRTYGERQYVDYPDIGRRGNVNYREPAFLQRVWTGIRNAPSYIYHKVIVAGRGRVQPQQYAAQTTLRSRSLDPALNTYAWVGRVQPRYLAQTTSRSRSVDPSPRVVHFAMAPLR
jgi:hypothetical protein